MRLQGHGCGCGWGEVGAVPAAAAAATAGLQMHEGQGGYAERVCALTARR